MTVENYRRYLEGEKKAKRAVDPPVRNTAGVYDQARLEVYNSVFPSSKKVVEKEKDKNSSD